MKIKRRNLGAKKKQPKPKRLDQLKVTMEAKEIFALAFEGAGGLQRLIDFLKTSNTNYGMFISHYAKLLPLSTVTEVNATVTVEDNQAAAQLEQILLNQMRVVQDKRTAKREELERAGITMIDGEPYRRVDTTDGVVYRPAPDYVPPPPVATYWMGAVGYTDDDEPIEAPPPRTIDAVANPPQPATADNGTASPVAETEPTEPHTASPVASPKIVNLSRQPQSVAPAPSVSEPSTTERYLEWVNNGGGSRMGRKDWGSI